LRIGRLDISGIYGREATPLWSAGAFCKGLPEHVIPGEAAVIAGPGLAGAGLHRDTHKA
jgi:hypothetical protein